MYELGQYMRKEVQGRYRKNFQGGGGEVTFPDFSRCDFSLFLVEISILVDPKKFQWFPYFYLYSLPRFSRLVAKISWWKVSGGALCPPHLLRHCVSLVAQEIIQISSALNVDACPVHSPLVYTLTSISINAHALDLNHFSCNKTYVCIDLIHTQQKN